MYFNCNLLVTGLDDVILEISKKPYEGIIFKARCALVLTNSILIDNLPALKCNKEMLDVYFTNPTKSGIESYKKIEILDDKRAIVQLKNKDGKHLYNIMLQYLKLSVLYPHRYAQIPYT